MFGTSDVRCGTFSVPPQYHNMALPMFVEDFAHAGDGRRLMVANLEQNGSAAVHYDDEIVPHDEVIVPDPSRHVDDDFAQQVWSMEKLTYLDATLSNWRQSVVDNCSAGRQQVDEADVFRDTSGCAETLCLPFLGEGHEAIRAGQQENCIGANRNESRYDSFPKKSECVVPPSHNDLCQESADTVSALAGLDHHKVQRHQPMAPGPTADRSQSRATQPNDHDQVARGRVQHASVQGEMEARRPTGVFHILPSTTPSPSSSPNERTCMEKLAAIDLKGTPTDSISSAQRDGSLSRSFLQGALSAQKPKSTQQIGKRRKTKRRQSTVMADANRSRCWEIDAKKLKNCARERKRQTMMNEAYAKLLQVLPAFARNRKHYPKVMVLRLAARYICDLTKFLKWVDDIMIIPEEST